MNFDFSIIFNKDALATLGEAYGWTLFIAVGALLIGVILGTLLAICKVIPKTNIVAKILDKISSVYVAIFRGTPLTVQLFIFYFVIFAGVTFFSASVTPYIIAVFGFGLNSAAYVSEIIRSGILSIDKGQMEAGRALGLSYGKTMMSVVLPQAAKSIIPPLGNEAITLVKDTSVALVIGVSEFFNTYGRVDIYTGTLGKAFGGAMGGFTTGRKEIIDMLRQRSRPYLFSNSVAPGIVGASLEMFKMLKESNELHDRLLENVNYFRDKMLAAGFDIKPTQSAICAVMLYDAKLSQDFAARMQEEGIYVTGFYYPVVPKGQARIRVQLSAGHRREHLDKAITAFIKVGKELGVIK